MNPVIKTLSLEQVDPNPWQPRIHFGADDLESLGASVGDNGFAQLPTVRPHPTEPDRYQLIDGERRLRSTKARGLVSMSFIVKDATDLEMAEDVLKAGLHGVNYNRVEQALGFKRYMAEFKIDQKTLAAKMGMDETTVSNRMRILQLPEAVQQIGVEGRLSGAHLQALCSVSDWPEDVEALATAALNEGWSTRQMESQVKAVKETRERERQPQLNVAPATVPEAAESAAPLAQDAPSETTEAADTAPEADDGEEETPARPAPTPTPPAPAPPTPAPTKSQQPPAKPAPAKAPKKPVATTVPTDKAMVAMVPGSLAEWLKGQGITAAVAIAQYKRLAAICAAQGVTMDEYLTTAEATGEADEAQS